MAQDAKPKFTKAKLTKVFAYLDKLRNSGVTNMFGAGPYVENAFDMDRKQSSAIVGLWMKSFSTEPPAVRAEVALTIQANA